MSDPEHPVPKTPCANPGNPVFSCMLKLESHTSSEDPALTRSQKLMYKTTYSDYGARAPTFEFLPCSYHPISQTFSQHLGTCGMYRDNSFNTSLDHSRVYIPNYKAQFNGQQ
ncbi:piercer of microtubule wall 2 protein-like [Misgurnus anguillicaudatus]|uniref:piercer of microtubule wall 2 protein-like n=1 Tax=Misgurnus anguillicaudatus TaxID=75329 RepID=UPI003CCF65F1